VFILGSYFFYYPRGLELLDGRLVDGRLLGDLCLGLLGGFLATDAGRHARDPAKEGKNGKYHDASNSGRVILLACYGGHCILIPPGV
jgi:hypothetical protein